MCGCRNPSPQQIQQQALANAQVIAEYRKKNTGIASNPLVKTDATASSFQQYRCSQNHECPSGMMCAGSRCVRKTMVTNTRSLR